VGEREFSAFGGGRRLVVIVQQQHVDTKRRNGEGRRTAQPAAQLRIPQRDGESARSCLEIARTRRGTPVAQHAAMRVLRQASKEILRRAVNPFAALVIVSCAAGCSSASDEKSETAPSVVEQDAAVCESTSLDAPCSVAADDEAAEDEAADDRELNRDELERELDRIEQEIAAPEP
jgi:hypothetical protein